MAVDDTEPERTKSLDDAHIEMEMASEEQKIPLQHDSTSTTSLPDVMEAVLRGPLAAINKLFDFFETRVRELIKNHNTLFTNVVYAIMLTGYLVYFAIACYINTERARNLLYLTIITVICFVYYCVKKYFGGVICKYLLDPVQIHFINRFWKIIKYGFIALFMVFLISWIIYDTIAVPERLISLAGLVIYVFIGYVFSRKRSRVKWQPVLWGFALQFVFGLIILRTDVGYDIFKWVGERITIFLGFSSEGSAFLFNDLHQIAFSVLPIIAYFSAFTYLLWYLGIIHLFIAKVSWLLQITLGTSPAESFNAAGNIFVGMVEAPLLIRPFLADMTESEIHAVMTGGFATIAGSVLGIYIYLGVSANHLLAASVMSAPAALAMSKLMCPEVEESRMKTVDDIQFERTEEKNVFEAISVGASMSINIIANIVVNIIAFLSLLKCANSILGWLGSMVGEPGFSFEYICSYVLMPFAFIMGISWDDSFKVAELLGVKTFLNEFVAYQRLSVFIKNRENGVGDRLSQRSEIITTYALCGFANFGSMGILLGSLGALVPNQSRVLAKHVVRAVIAATLACFMTACIAGILYKDDAYGLSMEHPINSTAPTNTTMATV